MQENSNEQEQVFEQEWVLKHVLEKVQMKEYEQVSEKEYEQVSEKEYEQP